MLTGSQFALLCFILSAPGLLVEVVFTCLDLQSDVMLDQLQCFDIYWSITFGLLLLQTVCSQSQALVFCDTDIFICAVSHDV